jgi:hypothetical protein
MEPSTISSKLWRDKPSLFQGIPIHVANEDEDDDVPVRRYCGDVEVM